MAIYPEAKKKLLDTQYLSGKSMAAYNRVNLHVQAGTGSLYNFFNHQGRSSSHFWVSYSGVVEQYVDTKLQAEADLDGNDATVSIETEGGTGSSADTDKWTTQQVDALVKLVKWILDTHEIPKKLAENSKSGSESSRGISWHRLGIDGNFPSLPDIRAGREQRGGGMHYSSSDGKICPGGGKIQQIPGILDRILGDDEKPEPEPDPSLLELIYMEPYVARKDASSTWYVITPASPKPFAVAVKNPTDDIRALKTIDFGDTWDGFLKTVTKV